jgi:hypothetical protein
VRSRGAREAGPAYLLVMVADTRHMVLMLLASFALRAGAQVVQRCPATVDSIARPCELDAWPTYDTLRNRPQYPDILRQAGVSGVVRVSYVVDTTGRLQIPHTVLERTHELFATSFRNASPRYRFAPPTRNGVAVRVLVEEVVEFVAPSEPGLVQLGRPVLFHGVDSTGTLVTRIDAYPPRDEGGVLEFSGADSADVIVAALTAIAARDSVPPPAAHCLTIDTTAFGASIWSLVRTSNPSFVPASRCPATYTTMVADPRLGPRPTGWIDPVKLEVQSLTLWARDHVLVRVQRYQGTWGSDVVCEVLRSDTTWGGGACVTVRQWLH